MNIEYERRPVTSWSKGCWYEVETGERVGSDTIEAVLNERWHSQNKDTRYVHELDNHVVLDLPELRPREQRKRKTSVGYYNFMWANVEHLPLTILFLSAVLGASLLWNLSLFPVLAIGTGAYLLLFVRFWRYDK
jgi:hypothetical protein